MPETAKTEYVIRLFKENWVRDFGLPKSIISDRDVRFTSKLWKAAAAEQGTQLQMTSGNHPEANGQVEQLNCAVQHLLRHYIKPNQVDWDEKLALIASLYNNAVHSTTGVSPNCLLLTCKPRLPLDFLLPDNQPSAAPGTLEFPYRYERLMQQAVKQMHRAQAAMIESENKHRCPSTFQVGDRVWVKSSELGQEHRISRKRMPQYFEPWEVLDIVGDDPDGPSHGGQLTPIHLKVEESYHRAAPGGTGGVKTISNYAPVLYTQLDAKRQGYSDVLYLDAVQNKYVEEVSSCNIFVVKGRQVLTPELGGTILPGITRKSILELAASLGYEVSECPVSVEDLLAADEVFCTGTAVVLSPVGSVTFRDKRFSYNDGEVGKVASELYKALTDLQTGKSVDTRGWTVELPRAPGPK
ncbi:hypothetical protein CBR_g24424 [Chara braunii]|uniref:Branched-chain-amino-acid aminotransferase n=1 Tax=Chara braunii TaxID=69332 RepID=A0A388JMS6_CHABU|nr:hypothetical protein CBR_g24424 [Chara braunii]|eukprot:GBG59081.1 hypothetical protein CBR_g24424 [Chara braunii]